MAALGFFVWCGGGGRELYFISNLRFIDYGDTEEKAASELMELPARLAEQPPFSRLVWLPRMGLTYNTREAMTTLENFLTRSSLQLSFSREV